MDRDVEQKVPTLQDSALILPESSIRQVGVIPFRLVRAQPEFCLISARRSRQWLFPKGHLDQRYGPQGTAIAEAMEEAGVCGRLWEEALSPVTFEKNGRWYQLTMWLLEVEQLLPDWKESLERTRIWASGASSLELLDRPYWKQLLTEACRRLSEFSEVDGGDLKAPAKVKRKR